MVNQPRASYDPRLHRFLHAKTDEEAERELECELQNEEAHVRRYLRTNLSELKLNWDDIEQSVVDIKLKVLKALRRHRHMPGQTPIQSFKGYVLKAAQRETYDILDVLYPGFQRLREDVLKVVAANPSHYARWGDERGCALIGFTHHEGKNPCQEVNQRFTQLDTDPESPLYKLDCSSEIEHNLPAILDATFEWVLGPVYLNKLTRLLCRNIEEVDHLRDYDQPGRTRLEHGGATQSPEAELIRAEDLRFVWDWFCRNLSRGEKCACFLAQMTRFDAFDLHDYGGVSWDAIADELGIEDVRALRARVRDLPLSYDEAAALTAFTPGYLRVAWGRAKEKWTTFAHAQKKRME